MNIRILNTRFKELIIKEAERGAGSTFINRVYAHNSLNEPEEYDMSKLLTKHKINALTMKLTNDRILVQVQEMLDNVITYDRLYMCNSNDDVVAVITIDKVSKSDIDEEYIIQIEETETIVS